MKNLTKVEEETCMSNKQNEEKTMNENTTLKRTIARLVLTAVAASVLLAASEFRGDPSGLVPRAHAQGNAEEQRSCTVASLDGSYGFFRTGWAPAGMVVGPLAAVGITTFDGAGRITARQTIVRNGEKIRDLFDSPTLGPDFYEVDPDCAGRLRNASTGAVFGHFVVVDGGNEVFLISLAPGNSVTGVLRKIHNRRSDRAD